MRVVPLVPAACAALLVAVATSPAHAQSDGDRATARLLGQQGETALDAKDYKTAEDNFRHADQLVHAPTLVLGLARSLAGEGKLVAAQEAYMRIIREGVAPGAPDAFTRALADAKREVATVTPKIGGMTITVKGKDGETLPSATVQLDDAPVSTASLGFRRQVDPGPHVVKASSDGYKSVELKVTVPVGGAADAPLVLEKDASGAPPASASAPPAVAPEPAAPAPAQDQSAPADTASSSGGRGVWPWVAFGVGGAGLVAGVVGGVLAMGKHSTLNTECGPQTCPTSAKSDLDAYHAMSTVSTVGFIVAGVGAAAGVVLLVLPASQSAAPPSTGLRVVPVVGLGSVGAVGEF